MKMLTPLSTYLDNYSLKNISHLLGVSPKSNIALIRPESNVIKAKMRIGKLNPVLEIRKTLKIYPSREKRSWQIK
jgi:hypothetical protein